MGLLPVVVLVVASLGHAEAQEAAAAAAAAAAAEAAAATSPAAYYPGYAGGGIFAGGKLCCSRTVCFPGWRSSCSGMSTAACRKRNCQTEVAPDGSVCDVNPCIQGLCWKGVCMGGGPATCPSHTEECMQYKCNLKTGQCRESCPKPNGTPCTGGSCKCGKCIPDPHTCPPMPNACSIYVFNNATMKCDLVNATCPKPPNTCKQLSCNPRTGLCTVVTNKPDNTSCPSGSCQGGECVPERICPSPCPVNPNPCKAFACNTATGQCNIVVNKPINTTCPGGSCEEGICKPAIKCPPTCPKHPSACKKFECDLTTGNCTIVVDKPDNTTCPNGKCQEGSCIPQRICPTPCPAHPDSCKAFACNSTSGQCSIVVNKPNNSTCPGGSCQDGTCKPVCPTCPPHPDGCKAFTCNTTTSQCTNVVNRPDGTLCPAGQCFNGTCTPDLICPVNPDPCQRYVLNPDKRNCTLIVDQDGTTCNDRRRCTTDDKCLAGICTGTPITCPQRTRDFRQCVQSVCDEATGGCVDVQSPDGTNCTDSSLCSTNDKCVSGVCRGTPVTCPVSPNACKSNVCNPLNGVCESKNINDGTSCNDTLWCTTNSFCVAGSCLGSPRDCPDPSPSPANQCKQAFCDEAAQQCSFTNRPDGTICDAPGTGRCSVDTCIAGSCVPGTRVDCSDLDDECNTGVCQAATGQCSKVPKPNSTPCDDGKFCTVGSTCSSGVCSGGSPRVCPSPRLFCTETYCSEALRSCLNLPKDCSGAADQCNAGVCSLSSGLCEKDPTPKDGASCDDGNKCTNQDTCSGGSCIGKPIVCPAPSNQCQISACDPINGGCINKNKPDNSSCTIGGGSAGLCRSDKCINGQCVAGEDMDCSNLSDDCNEGECDPDTGKCVKRPRQSLGGPIPCTTPGLFCIVNQVCSNGICGCGSPRVCNSTDKCQTLSCNEATDTCDIVQTKDCSRLNGPCTEGRCRAVDGECFAANVNETLPCNDGKFCTIDTVCKAGLCTGGKPRNCTTTNKCEPAVCNELANECKSTPKTCPDSQCMLGACDPSNGECYGVPKPNTTPCTGPNNCTGTCSNDGSCTCSPEVICPVNPDPCQRYVLNPDKKNCTLIIDANGTACDDRRRCTTDDKCEAGVCTGKPKVCLKRTKDFRQCVQSVCDEKTGDCVDVQSPDGTNCTDSSLCTTNDTCVSGECKGSPVVCPVPANPCKAISCNPLNGICESKNVHDGERCNDAQWCTVNSVCVEGSCVGSARPCRDPPPSPANQCKQAFCNETAQQCSFEDRPDGTLCDAAGTGRCSVDTCIAGSCVPGTRVDCSDLDDECNTGVCQTASGTCAKVPKPDSTPCEDGKFCTEGSTCTAGKCGGGQPKVCPSPKRFCTDTYCSEALRSCLNLPKNCSGAADQCNAGVCSLVNGLCEKDPKPKEGASCDDGNKCTEQDTCDDGDCKGTPKVCPAPANQCQISECDAASGGCVNKNKPDNSSCTIGGGSAGLCRSDKCVNGQCVKGDELNCSNLNDDCNEGVCDPGTGKCVKRPRKPDGIPCSTGLFCIVNQVCSNGVCGGGSPRVCNSTNLCETLSCNEATNTCDIVSTTDCSRFSGPCTEGRCNPADGSCFAANIKEDQPCDDDRFCTTGTVCKAGRCTGGSTKQCTPADKCETAVCNELLDKCVSTPITCPDTSQCMRGVCDPAQGNCYDVPKPTNTSCTGPPPNNCPGTCSSDGTCVWQCIIPPPTKCTSSSQCGAGKCCCDSECVASQVTLRLKGASDDDACEYTCLNRDCQKSKGPNQVCNCVKDCDGPNCSSAGGNPCKANGVCCCNKQAKPGKTYEDSCVDCQAKCNERHPCTGNYPPWAACKTPT
uniref:Uncharacterized protein n=1 Tax=Tetradesmus obliquus TaxID=3088 RepID=A0A383V479_TETOB|eukprot:jgi/Sobl393_1/12680/SZX59720.1